MLTLGNIDNFFRKGRGLSFTFYITNEELAKILHESTPIEYSPYSVIYVKELDDFALSYHEVLLEDFLSNPDNLTCEFFLQSDTLAPPVKKHQRDNMKKFLMYNGLINFSHGNKRKGKVEESSIMMVNKYIRIGRPDNVFYNKEYEDIYRSTVKGIKTCLKYRGRFHWLDGRTMDSKTKIISPGFAQQMELGQIKSNVEVLR